MEASSTRIQLIQDHAGIRQVEDLQALIWGRGDVVPYHLLQAVLHGGGVLLGAFDGDRLIGFVFGFAAFDDAPSNRTLRHHSHMLAVHPDWQTRGVGFQLKRAQWQWVRQQGVERITWTYDPLISRNAYLNIARLGAVCSTYFPDYYGEMTDAINAGLPSDRFQVDWWVSSPRVEDRLKSRPRRPLELGDYFSAGAEIVNPTKLADSGFPQPPEKTWLADSLAAALGADPPQVPQPPFYLVEIPPDFQTLRERVPDLGLLWRRHTREVFQHLFARGYLVTDFIYMRGASPRSFYLLSDGERRIGAIRKSS